MNIKKLGALVDGGAIITNDSELAEKVSAFKNTTKMNLLRMTIL